MIANITIIQMNKGFFLIFKFYLEQFPLIINFKFSALCQKIGLLIKHLKLSMKLILIN